jgi:hypothetical protein
MTHIRIALGLLSMAAPAAAQQITPLDVAALASAPILDGRVGSEEYGAPVIRIGTAAGDVEVRMGRAGGSVYVAATLPDTSFYWGDDFVVSLDHDGSGGSDPGAGDRQWYLRRVLDSSVVATAEGGAWHRPGTPFIMLGPSRSGDDWSVASMSNDAGWTLELRIDERTFRTGEARARIAFRTYNSAPHGWWSWPPPPSGERPQRVERNPGTWIPVQLE